MSPLNFKMSKPFKNRDLLTSIVKIEKKFTFFLIGITFSFILVYVLFQDQNRIVSAQIYFVIVSALLLFGGYLSLRNALSKTKSAITNLYNSKHEALSKIKQLEEMYISKEASLQELQGLNYAINNAALFASIDQDGKVVDFSKKFSKLLGLQKTNAHIPFEEILSLDEGEQQTIHQLLKGKRKSIWIGEVRVTTKTKEKLWLEMSIIPMNQVKNNHRALILCTDITARIISQLEINKLTEQRFTNEVSQQKLQASQIVEAQEEERKRIAKDIHDGIGQMLTALKFNIESIKPSNIVSTTTKVENLKEFLRSLIKEVRTVTFNLTPPELNDYGIVPTLNKLVKQLSNLTGKNIYFENKTNFEQRFDSLVEINLYRVVQEAVNNAIKYANSNYILITLSHSDTLLSVVIDDDGDGFDYLNLVRKNKESGMGLFFMKERIRYINGRIFINSIKNKGTRITINIDIPKS